MMVIKKEMQAEMMRFDPFREIDRLTQSTWSPRSSMPLDVYRKGENFVVRVDLPGIDTASLDLTLERNVLSIKAERSWIPAEGVDVMVAERPQGTFTRRLFLSEGLDADKISAQYDKGVLTVTVPVADSAKSRKIEVGIGVGSSQDGNVLDVGATQN